MIGEPLQNAECTGWRVIPEVSTQHVTRLWSVLPFDNVKRHFDHILEKRA